MKTAAVYIRVSTEEQTEHSPDSQLHEIKKYAKAHDMIIDTNHIYTDAGISGRSANKRPAFQQMISAAKGKPSPFDVILVWKFSRFARNQEESILYKSLLNKECKVEVVSITESTDDSMFGSLIERIIEWMDEFYSIRLSEEVRTKMTEVAAKGRVQTVAPFGYKKEPGRPMEIVPEEAKWIEYIFERFIAGDTMFGIATSLNKYGVKTHRGNRFENRTVEYILYNPMYVGYVRWTPTGRTVSKRIFDSEDTMTVKSDFEPIISEELFKKAGEIMSERKKRRKKYSKPTDVQKHWLSGMVKCSDCGGSLVFQRKNNGWNCSTYVKGACKVSHYITDARLQEGIFDGLSRVIISDEFIKDNTKVIPTKASMDYDMLIARSEKMLGKAKTAYLEGIDTLDEYSSNKDRLSAEIESLIAKREAEKTVVEYTEVKDVEKRFSDVISLLRSDEDDQVKHVAFSSIVDKVVFSKADDTLDIFFNL